MHGLLIYTPQLDKCFIEPAQRQESDDPEFGKPYVLKKHVHKGRRRLGQPMAIAAAVCFLASPAKRLHAGTHFRIRWRSTPTGGALKPRKRIQSDRPIREYVQVRQRARMSFRWTCKTDVLRDRRCSSRPSRNKMPPIVRPVRFGPER